MRLTEGVGSQFLVIRIQFRLIDRSLSILVPKNKLTVLLLPKKNWWVVLFWLGFSSTTVDSLKDRNFYFFFVHWLKTNTEHDNLHQFFFFTLIQQRRWQSSHHLNSCFCCLCSRTLCTVLWYRMNRVCSLQSAVSPGISRSQRSLAHEYTQFVYSPAPRRKALRLCCTRRWLLIFKTKKKKNLLLIYKLQTEYLSLYPT